MLRRASFCDKLNIFDMHLHVLMIEGYSRIIEKSRANILLPCVECFLVVKDRHTAEIEQLEKSWPQYKDASHHALSQLPEYTRAVPKASLWAAETDPDTFEEAYADARRDGETFRQKYMEDVQFVLSRTNHHHHRWTKHGRVPLTACRPKGRKNSKVCKGGFPKEKQVTAVARIVCKGVATQMALRVRGRRNALGSIMGKRNCQWLCGSARILTSLLRSNTNTMPNYRVPILPETHDARCGQNCVDDDGMMQKLCTECEGRGSCN